MEHPKIEHKGVEFFQVGCSKCQQGDYWKIYSNGEVFVAECKCGHMIEIKGKSLEKKPDEKPIPMRQIV